MGFGGLGRGWVGDPMPWSALGQLTVPKAQLGLRCPGRGGGCLLSFTLIDLPPGQCLLNSPNKRSTGGTRGKRILESTPSPLKFSRERVWEPPLNKCPADSSGKWTLSFPEQCY